MDQPKGDPKRTTRVHIEIRVGEKAEERESIFTRDADLVEVASTDTVIDLSDDHTRTETLRQLRAASSAALEKAEAQLEQRVRLDTPPEAEPAEPTPGGDGPGGSAQERRPEEAVA